MLVLEQLAHDVERLPIGNIEKFASQRGTRQQRLAFGFRQRLGVALGQEDVAGNRLRLAVPVAESLRVFFRKTCNVGDRFFEIAPEHQRRAITVRLSELVAGGDVGHALVEAEILEPGRLADVEVID